MFFVLFLKVHVAHSIPKVLVWQIRIAGKEARLHPVAFPDSRGKQKTEREKKYFLYCTLILFFFFLLFPPLSFPDFQDGLNCEAQLLQRHEAEEMRRDNDVQKRCNIIFKREIRSCKEKRDRLPFFFGSTTELSSLMS